jgi:catechol 2,3-dioxygenase-like lactoylglutathione lyase family enzyme
MIRLMRIGHVALGVADIERSRAFYTTLLGFEVVEEDPEHGGVFMAPEGLSHTIDLFPADDPRATRAEALSRQGRGDRDTPLLLPP